jgi:hypothetical protein
MFSRGRFWERRMLFRFGADSELRPLDTVALGEVHGRTMSNSSRIIAGRPSTSACREWMTVHLQMPPPVELP